MLCISTSFLGAARTQKLVETIYHLCFFSFLTAPMCLSLIFTPVCLLICCLYTNFATYPLCFTTNSFCDVTSQLLSLKGGGASDPKKTDPYYSVYKSLFPTNYFPQKCIFRLATCPSQNLSVCITKTFSKKEQKKNNSFFRQ